MGRDLDLHKHVLPFDELHSAKLGTFKLVLESIDATILLVYGEEQLDAKQQELEGKLDGLHSLLSKHRRGQDPKDPAGPRGTEREAALKQDLQEAEATLREFMEKRSSARSLTPGDKRQQLHCRFHQLQHRLEIPSLNLICKAAVEHVPSGKVTGITGSGLDGTTIRDLVRVLPSVMENFFSDNLILPDCSATLVQLLRVCNSQPLHSQLKQWERANEDFITASVQAFHLGAPQKVPAPCN